MDLLDGGRRAATARGALSRNPARRGRRAWDRLARELPRATRRCRRLLAAADIHCQPNTGPEPFGITFIEALYAGLPVVTTSIGGALEIVDGSCGMLVEPNDPAALAGALRRLIEDRELRADVAEFVSRMNQANDSVANIETSVNSATSAVRQLAGALGVGFSVSPLTSATQRLRGEDR